MIISLVYHDETRVEDVPTCQEAAEVLLGSDLRCGKAEENTAVVDHVRELVSIHTLGVRVPQALDLLDPTDASLLTDFRERSMLDEDSLSLLH